MSGSNTPIPPPAAPTGSVITRRRPRVMTKLPIYTGIGTAVLLFGVGAYVFLYETNPTGTTSAQIDSSLLSAQPAADMGKDRFLNPPSPPRQDVGMRFGGLDVQAPGQSWKAPEHVHPGVGMSETEIAGRKQAWTQYYQDLQQASALRRGALQAALVSDVTSTPIPRGGNKTGGGASGSGSSGGGGGGSAAPQGPTDNAGASKGPSGGLQDVYGPSQAGAAESNYLATEVTQPLYPLEVKQGDFILCSVVSGMTNELGGQVKLQVSTTVSDHATGMHPLIPAGSTLLVTYSNEQKYGDERVAAALTRITYPPPGDESLNIGTMPVGDGAGYVGLTDLVDRHTGRIIFNAALTGLFGATTSLAQQSVSGAVGGNIANFGNQITPRAVEAKPTITIRPGSACSVQMTADIGFDHEWVPSAPPVPPPPPSLARSASFR